MRQSWDMKQGDRVGVKDAPCRLPAQQSGVAATLHLSFLAFLVALWCVEAVAADRTPEEHLARMSESLQSLSYEGTIVYLHGHKLEALRIFHRVEEGQVRERLVSLNGPVRTLTRENGRVTCELSSSRPISIQGHGAGKDILRAWTLDPAALHDHYRVHSLGTARVAGRQTEVVGIAPRDSLRYGYRFYLDEESGLPLKSDLMGEQSDPIEQIMFTSLDLLPSQEPGRTAAAPVPRRQGAESRHRPGSEGVPPDALPWQFDFLPPGFTLVMQDNWRDTGGPPVEHLVLSDGLASVSVYVEREPRERLEGGTRIGAVHAVGKQVSGHQITVVGEVPFETVDAVLAGIRWVPGVGQ